MALSRKTFHCKLPQGLLEISERVFVFNCCLTSNISDINEHRAYVGHTVDQLHEHFPDSLLMAHNFGDENHRAQISSILSEYGVAVINHHCQNKTFPLLTQDTIHHFLSLSYNWISSSRSNLLLIHCEKGCLPVLAFIIAAFLICSKKYTDARKILGAIYKLDYVWRRDTGLEWWAPTCRELRLYGEWPCGPIFRINEPDSYMASYRTCKESETGRFFRQADCELVKVRFSEMDSTFLLAGLDSAGKDKDDLPAEACVKIQETCSNIHSRGSEAGDDLKTTQRVTVSRPTQENLENMSRLSGTAGKFGDVFLQNEAKPCVNTPYTVQNLKISSVSSDLVNKDGELLKVLTETQRGSFKSCYNSDSTSKKKELGEQHVFVHWQAHSKIVLPQVSQTSPGLSPSPLSRYRGTASSALGITALLHDHAEFSNQQVHHKDTMEPTDSFMPESTEEKPPLDKYHIISRSELKSPPPPPPPLPSFLAKSVEFSPLSSVPSPPPLLPLPFSDVSDIRNQPAANGPHPLTSSSESSSSTRCQDSSFMPPAKNSTAPPAAPPPPAPPLHAALPPAKNSTAPPAAPSPPAPPLHAALPPAKNSFAPPAAPSPPPPPLHAAFLPARSRQTAVAPPPAPFSKGGPTYLQSVKGKLQPRTSVKAQTQAQTRKAPLRPYHWLKLTRAMQGSLWAEVQKPEEASKVLELDISELESLFSTTITNSDHGGNVGKANRHGSGLKPDKTHLIELRRAYNCEIMLTKVKVPLPDLMNSVLALDDSALDVDQVDNLIKFCPTKEEIQLLKNYNGERESLGKCEQFFLEMMRVPRVESKLRVFSFKIQFFSQLSDLRNSLNIVNSASQEVRNSVKLKRIMQSILSLGNALNQGTARGSAVGFRLDSLLKLGETRSKNNKLTLIHYLCKVLADKMPEVLDFYEDLASVEAATKIQLKHLAEEMQALSKGLEKVAQEINASEKDGALSEHFCKTLKEFYGRAEAEVRGLASIYSVVGKNADALALYFGEDPARCPFEQVVSTILSFLRMFRRAHDENCKQKELEKKKAQKQVEYEKSKLNVSRN